MIIGIPREIKKDEYRVALLPVGAQLLVEDGHTVLVEKGAGRGCGYDDADYIGVGAELVDTASEIYQQAEMVIKVKEPQPVEIAELKENQILFCYFHFAGSRELIEDISNYSNWGLL